MENDVLRRTFRPTKRALYENDGINVTVSIRNATDSSEPLPESVVG
jgi:hypothetical protein